MLHVLILPLGAVLDVVTTYPGVLLLDSAGDVPHHRQKAAEAHLGTGLPRTTGVPYTLLD